ncbi:MAG: putative membrane protein [Bacteroidia bacterium]|jgi:uncharacterized membrane protein
MFLIWNLILASIPIAIGQNMNRVRNRFIFFVLLGLTLLFLPNTSYLITDFVHFRRGSRINLWYDLVLFFTYAFTGLMLMIYTIDAVAQDLLKRFSQRSAVFFKLLVFPIIGCGIYVGRIARWNSWDVFVHPFAFVSDMIDLVFSNQLFEFIALSGLFGGFCGLFYLFFTHIKYHNSVSVINQTN